MQIAQANEIAKNVATGERETGKGVNQIGTLHRAGATRWSSHFESICSLVDMYVATCTVLENLVDEGSTPAIRGEAQGHFRIMKTFEFVFILHLMHKIMALTDMLCKSLQNKSLDILNAVNCVKTTAGLLSTLRENGWDSHIEHVESVCRENDIDMPKMGAPFKGGRSSKGEDHITFEHHYHFDVFNTVIDYQLMELNNRFNDEAMELLILSSALEPKDGFKSFKAGDICKLASKFYLDDFTQQEMYCFKSQLQHYELYVPYHEKFKNMSTISELCRGLTETQKSQNYYLIDRLIRLVLTLPVSTATTERAFSAMKLIKSSLRNKMGDEFLVDSMVVYIERELAENIDTDSIIDAFESLGNRRVLFH